MGHKYDNEEYDNDIIKRRFTKKRKNFTWIGKKDRRKKWNNIKLVLNKGIICEVQMIEKREVVNKNILHHNKKLKSICDRVKLNNIFVDNDNDRKDIKYKKQNNNAFNT